MHICYLARWFCLDRVTESLQPELSVVLSLNETLEHVTGTVRLCRNLEKKRRQLSQIFYSVPVQIRR